MLVELGLGVLGRQAVEVGERVGLVFVWLVAVPGLAHQVVYESLGVDPLLDVQGRRVNYKVGPVLLVLAPPDELRVEVPVAPLVGHLNRALLFLPHQRLVLGRGQVPASSLVVRQGLDSL